jgi:hypothetical protein
MQEESKEHKANVIRDAPATAKEAREEEMTIRYAAPLALVGWYLRVSFVKCSCGKLACITGIIGAETLCPWCDRVGALVRHGPLLVIGMKDR